MESEKGGKTPETPQSPDAPQLLVSSVGRTGAPLVDVTPKGNAVEEVQTGSGGLTAPKPKGRRRISAILKPGQAENEGLKFDDA